MKIVFLSNYFNHHQKPFSDAMYRLIGDEYRFVETALMSNERKALGWGGIAIPSYVIRSEGAFTAQTQELIDSADAVIIGSAPDSMIKNRIRDKKLILRYSERPLKKGMEWKKYFPRLILWNLRSPFYKPIYMLCASAYTAPDYAKFGIYLGKCFKWGYFPETKRYENIDTLITKKKNNSILWCARFLDWKHPELAVEVARRLKQDGYVFELTMIGIGERFKYIQDLIIEQSLQDCVHLLGSMTPEEVRAHMEKSEIFLFTSDRNEGWGAVLNESMNSACAVVADRAIGSVPFLIKDGENGDIYKEGNVDELYKRVRALLDNPKTRIAKGAAAYRTIIEQWNAEIAAERLIQLTQYLLAKRQKELLFVDGVCGKAL